VKLGSAGRVKRTGWVVVHALTVSFVGRALVLGART